MKKMEYEGSEYSGGGALNSGKRAVGNKKITSRGTSGGSTSSMPKVDEKKLSGPKGK